jgi:hypothetical protein
MVEKLKLPSPEVPSDTSAQVLPEKGTMSTPNNQNPYDPENSSSGLPSYNDYSQGAGENYNQAYNDGYGQPNGAGFEQFPADASQNYLQTGYAGAGRRLGALVLDFLIVGIVTGILFAILFNSSYSSYTDDVNAWIDNGQVGAQPTPDTSLTVGTRSFPTSSCGSYTATWACDDHLGRALLGKRMAVRIKVVDCGPPGGPSRCNGIPEKRNSWVTSSSDPSDHRAPRPQLVIGIASCISIDKDPRSILRRYRSPVEPRSASTSA